MDLRRSSTIGCTLARIDSMMGVPTDSRIYSGGTVSGDGGGEGGRARWAAKAAVRAFISLSCFSCLSIYSFCFCSICEMFGYDDERKRKKTDQEELTLELVIFLL